MALKGLLQKWNEIECLLISNMVLYVIMYLLHSENVSKKIVVKQRGLCFRSGAVFVLIQKPITSGKKLTESHWCQVGQYAALRALLSILWAYGLFLCGPFRTILVYEQYDFVAVTLIGSLFTGGGGHSTVRGTALFAFGIISLLLFDHDDNRLIQSEDLHTIYPLSWLGLSDHKLGVCLLTLLVACRLGVCAYGRRVANKLVSINGTLSANSGGGVGASKRLHALTTLLEGIILLPVSFIVLQFSEVKINGSWFTTVILLLLIAVVVFVQDYYVDAVCAQRLGLPYTARYGSLSVMLGALVIAYFWSTGSKYNYDESEVNLDVDHKAAFSSQSPLPMVEEHVLSGGGIVACFLFLMGALSLTSSSVSGAKGSLVGYSEAGIPLYSLTASSSAHSSSGFPCSIKSAIAICLSSLKQVLHDNNSRRIFYFLCLNLSFTGIEFLYGIWTNSLGLISDGFHMLFDCSALFMGLVAAVVARWKPSKTFSYGYGRVEDLSGFTNGLFLVVISSFVFWEAIGRLLDPPSVGTQQLLAVSVAGLCVNLLGILAFSSRHTHSTPEVHQHHHHHHHGHSHNANVEGVFLHILADTLGSIGVITSSILIEQFGWFIADPICSLFIAILIFVSVIPFLKHSCLVLLLRTPTDADRKITSTIEKVMSVDGIIGVSHSQFWQHSADTCYGTLHVQAKPEASEQFIIQQVTALFKEIGLRQITVQVEKEEFFSHLVSLNSKYRGQGFNFCAENALTVVKAL